MDTSVYSYLKDNKRDILLYCTCCKAPYILDFDVAVEELNNKERLCDDCIVNSYAELEEPQELNTSFYFKKNNFFQKWMKKIFSHFS